MKQSLFDALNVAPGSGLKLKVTATAPSSSSRIVVTHGDTITLVVFGSSIDLTTGELTIGALNCDEYKIEFTCYDEDDNEVGTGILNGDPVTISQPVALIDIDSATYLGPGSDPEDTTVSVPLNAGGIFATLARMNPDAAYFYDEMDVDYLGQSGTKSVSHLVEMYLTKYGEAVAGAPCIRVLKPSGVLALANLIWKRYGEAWGKIYEALETEYAPLENYDMTEEDSPDLLETRGVSDDYERTEHRERASKVTTENTGTDTDASVYGFNSSTAVPESHTETAGTVTAEALPADNYEDATFGQTGEETIAHTGTRTLTRHGNIGVTTSQQLLESEIALRVKNHMDDIIYRDVDHVLTTCGYSPILSETINII